MTTQPVSKYLAVSLLAGLLLACGEQLMQAANYSVVLPPGYSLIGNPLDNGNNAANVVFPNPNPTQGGSYSGPYDNDLIETWNCSAWSIVFFDSETTDTTTGFVNAAGNPVPAPILAPGCAFIFDNKRGAAETVVFTGTVPTPVLPPPCYCGCGMLSYLSLQGTNSGTFQSLTGYAPAQGDELTTFNGVGFTTNTFLNGSWSGGTPVVNPAIGYGVVIPCASTNCCAGCVAPYPESYSVTVYPGENYLADDLCQGTNDTVADILPSVPLKTKVEIWNPATQSFISDTYVAGGWSDPSLTLSPGEGFILVSPATTTFTLTISGCPPACPPPCLPPTNGFVLVGAFGTNTATWSNLSSCPPICGTEVITFNPQTQQSMTNTYINGLWVPAAPVLGVGQSAFVGLGSDFGLTVVCPTNKTVPCGSQWTFDAPTAVSCCSSNFVSTNGVLTNVMITALGTATSGVCPQLITETWLISDACGESNVCSQTVTQSCLEVECPTNKTVQCGTPWSFDPPIVMNCCSNLVLAQTAPVTNGTCPQVITTSFIVSNGCGDSVICTQAVTVVNTNPPVINCPGNIVVSSCTNVPVCYVVTATNACCSNVTVTCTPPSCSWFAPGTVTTVFCTAEDCCSNSASCSFTVTVINLSAPELLCSNLTLSCGSPLSTNPPACYDPCCTNVTIRLLGSTTNSSGCGMVITQTWEAVDLCSFQSNICTRVIHILPSMATLQCQNLTIPCGTPIPTNRPAYTDPCCTNVEITLLSSKTVAQGCNLVITRTWQSVDLCCDTTNTCEQQITVVSSGIPAFETLYSFAGADGAAPLAPLVQGTDGNFYGTTEDGGGTNNAGTVFEISPGELGYSLTTLYTFSGPDGQNPSGALVQGTDGNFYGTTESGGDNGVGTAFVLYPNGSNSTLVTLYSFGASAADGQYPVAGLVQGTDGNFYGATKGGGSNALGTVFELALVDWIYTSTTLYSFGSSSADGQYPTAPLVQGSDGNLYGTTAQGGSNGYGAVFQLSLTNSQGGNGSNVVVTMLYSFGNGSADGQNPEAGLVQGTDGNFYGTTAAGGSNGFGTVFVMATNPPYNVSILHSFNGSDGMNPVSTLVEGSDGTFYGTTESGGTNNSGTAYDLNPGLADTLTTLYSFSGPDGALPQAGVIQGSDGSFYGVTSQGGANGLGGIFNIKRPCAALQLLCVNTNVPCNSAAVTNPPAWTDSCCTNVRVTLIASSFSTNRCETVITQTWQAVDECYDYTNTCSRVVKLLPSTATLYCSNFTTFAGSPSITNPPAWKDPCCTNVEVTLVASQVHIGPNCVESILQTWQAVDLCCGTTDRCERVVTIDPGPPQLLCSNLTIPCGSSLLTTPPGYVDSCCPNVRVTLIGSTSSGSGCSETVTQTWEAIDECTHKSNTCMRVVTFLPSSPLLLCSNLTITCGSPVPTNPPAWTDSCCTNVEVTLIASTNYGGGCSQGIVMQTWQAVDLCCGTTDLCTRSITIEPSPPELVCNNIRVPCGAPIPTNPPAWFDACCSNVIVSLISSSTSSNGCNPVITRVWQAVDQCCGLSDTCTQLVTLGSIGTPVVTYLHDFNGSDGATPEGPLMEGSDGNFYGTTSYGGKYDYGTVFRMTPSGSLTTLYSFGSFAGDGLVPAAGLVQDSAGNLYGVTTEGGANNSYGTVFMLSPKGSGYLETILYSFDYTHGEQPQGTLILDSAGNLYGTTAHGGANGANYFGFGKVFELIWSSSGYAFTTLYNFNTGDGWYPYGTLLRDSSGNLWGTTLAGGASLGGTVFELSPPSPGASAYTLTTQHNFDPASSGASAPYAGLMLASDGNYYGTFSFGGAPSTAIGGVFRIIPSMPSPYNYDLLCTFPHSGVNGPESVPVEGCDGNLYVTTENTGSVVNEQPQGGVYAVNPNNGNQTLLVAFSSNPAPNTPVAGLLLGSDGNFYGTTEYGGTGKSGTIFRMCGPCCASAALSIGTFGGNTLLSWPPGGVGAEPWQVQTSTNLLNWSTLPGSNFVSPLLIDRTGQLQFFRLIQTNVSN